ncbi:MAG: hypothetical protein ACYCX3_12650 [Thermoleophilia bacterium]
MRTVVVVVGRAVVVVVGAAVVVVACVVVVVPLVVVVVACVVVVVACVVVVVACVVVVAGAWQDTQPELPCVELAAEITVALPWHVTHFARAGVSPIVA